MHGPRRASAHWLQKSLALLALTICMSGLLAPSAAYADGGYGPAWYYAQQGVTGDIYCAGAADYVSTPQQDIWGNSYAAHYIYCSYPINTWIQTGVRADKFISPGNYIQCGTILNKNNNDTSSVTAHIAFATVRYVCGNGNYEAAIGHDVALNFDHRDLNNFYNFTL